MINSIRNGVSCELIRKLHKQSSLELTNKRRKWSQFATDKKTRQSLSVVEGPLLAQSGRSPQAWVITFAYWALHRFAAADPGPVIRRALLAIWAVKSSILERNSLRIGDLFALL